MNDFSELENELRKLRPAQPSPVLFERVGQALSDSGAGCRGAAACSPPLGRPGGRPSLVVVRLGPGYCRGFGSVRGSHDGPSAAASTDHCTSFVRI